MQHKGDAVVAGIARVLFAGKFCASLMRMIPEATTFFLSSGMELITGVFISIFMSTLFFGLSHALVQLV